MDRQWRERRRAAKARELVQSQARQARRAGELLDAANAAARATRHALLFFLATTGLGYALIISVTHRQLFLDTPVRLPFLGLEIKLQYFFVFAPLFILVMHFAILLQHALLARKLHAALAHDGWTPHLQDRLSSFHFVQHMVGGHDSRFFTFVLGLHHTLAVYIFPAVLMVFTLWRFLPFHSEPMTWLHRILMWLDVTMMVFFCALIHKPREKLRLGRMISMRGLWMASTTLLLLALGLFLNVPQTNDGKKGWLEHHLLQWGCPVTEIRSANINRKACLFSAWLTEKGYLPQFLDPYLRRNLYLANEDFVPDHKWEPNAEPSLHLSMRDYRYVNLTNADLHRAVLRETDFRGSILTKAQFYNSDLYKSNFSFSDANMVNFNNSNLEMSKFVCSDLIYSNFKKSYLVFSDFTCSFLSFANFTYSNLSVADLKGIYLSNTNFYRATLKDAHIQASYINNAVFINSNLEFAHLEGSYLSYSDLHSANFKKANFNGALIYKSIIYNNVIINNALIYDISIKLSNKYSWTHTKQFYWWRLMSILSRKINRYKYLDIWLRKYIKETCLISRRLNFTSRYIFLRRKYEVSFGNKYVDNKFLSMFYIKCNKVFKSLPPDVTAPYRHAAEKFKNQPSSTALAP